MAVVTELHFTSYSSISKTVHGEIARSVTQDRGCRSCPMGWPADFDKGAGQFTIAVGVFSTSCYSGWVSSDSKMNLDLILTSYTEVSSK